MLALLLVGCGTGGVANHDPDTFKIMFLTSINAGYNEALEDYINDILSDEVDDDLEIEVMMSMPNFDRLTIEIMTREVDMFVVEGWLVPPLLDPLGLMVIDQFSERVDPEVRSTYMTENEEETAEHLYMVPLNEGSSFSEETGFLLEEGLATGIVSSTPHYEAALKLIEEWL